MYPDSSLDGIQGRSCKGDAHEPNERTKCTKLLHHLEAFQKGILTMDRFKRMIPDIICILSAMCFPLLVPIASAAEHAARKQASNQWRGAALGTHSFRRRHPKPFRIQAWLFLLGWWRRKLIYTLWRTQVGPRKSISKLHVPRSRKQKVQTLMTI
jgi:hypothetical protein